jgi:hypothetical protein
MTRVLHDNGLLEIASVYLGRRTQDLACQSRHVHDDMSHFPSTGLALHIGVEVGETEERQFREDFGKLRE